MAWFKVDDGFYSSRKVLSIPRDERLGCMGVWVIAGAWASKEMTNGRVPLPVLFEFGANLNQIERLVSSGLWKRGDGIVEFHDWLEYQPAKEELIQKRKEMSFKRSEAGRIGAEKRWQKDSKRIAKKVLPLANADFAIEPLQSEVNESLAQDGKMANAWQADGKRIAPTRPDPTPLTIGKPIVAEKMAKKATQIPATWQPNETHVEFAKSNGLNLQIEANQFKDHAEATGRSMKNWDAAFRLWLGNAVKWNKPVQKQTVTHDWMND